MTFTKKSAITTLILSVTVWLASFGSVHAERITDFTVLIEVSPDGTLQITERIVYDFETAAKHGIYRAIDNQHAQPASVWYKKRSIELLLESVTRNGAPEPYREESHNGLFVRIGSPESTVTGVQEYLIRYTAGGALSVYDDLPELYWNVTGNEWQVPIEKVSVTVQAASPLLQPTAACYAGIRGSTARCIESDVISEYQSSFVARDIVPGAEVTIAQALSSEVSVNYSESVSEGLVWFIAIVGWIIGFGVLLFRSYTTHRVDEPVIAQYEPLADHLPMYTGVLFDFQLDPRDVSAGIVHLAEQGFLRIRKTSDKVLGVFTTDDYEVTLLRPISETQTTFQSTLLTLLFEAADTPGTVTKLSKLRTNNSKRTRNAQLLQTLHQAVMSDLKTRGYVESNWRFLFATIGVFVVYVLGVQGVFLWLVGYVPSIVPFFIVFLLSVILAAAASTRRTEQGYRAKQHLLGFKQFLSVTDKERFAFHNAPEKNPEQFMTYLPYAIAFGVEEKWTALFADIQMAPPTWYSSTTGGTFSAVAFTHDLAAFTGALASSGGSASSGGGSAGGGSGGGGGGSW